MNDDMRRCRVLKLELIRREVELRLAGEQNPLNGHNNIWSLDVISHTRHDSA
jgi:hypothetical protein